MFISQFSCNNVSLWKWKKVATFHIAFIQLQYSLAVLHGIMPVLEFDLCLGSVVVRSHRWYNGKAPVIEDHNETRPLC